MTLLASVTPMSHRAPADRVTPLLRWGKWAVLVLAAVLYTWALGRNGYANDYYAAAIYSGTKSWKAFFFGALDAGSYITVDKPPFALWVMGLSARIFGFGTWSMLLPQAAAGVASVALVHSAAGRALRGLDARAAGAAALLAALVMTLTPITVAINRDNNPDTVLVLLLVAAGWFCMEAIRTGRLRTLLVTAVLVGLAFNTKMLQAYLVLPGFALTYLYAAPGAFVRRIGRLLAAGAVLVVTSAWWMVVVDRWPVSSRPYIGGSTDNTVWDLVIGYNGLGRIFGGAGNGGGPGRLPADAPEGVTRAFGGGPGGGAGGGFGGASGAGRLFNDVMAGQISWLLPFAAVALVCGLVLVSRPRLQPSKGTARDAVRASLLVWGGWLVVHYAVFSFSSGTFHPYYTTAMAPAVAALTGVGGVLMWRAARASAAWRLILAAAVAVTGAWSFVVLRRTPEFVPWLAWVVAGATAVAVLALAVTAFAGRGTESDTESDTGRGGPAGRGGRAAARITAVALAAAVAAGLAGPAAYAVTPLGAAVNGTNPTAGPSQGMGGPFGRGGFGGMTPPGGMRPGGATAPGGEAPGGNTQAGAVQDRAVQDRAVQGGRGMRGPGGQVDAAMAAYLKRNKGSATWLVAVDSAQSASSLILSTGEPVIAMGGFTGSDPAMTVDKLQRYVAEGKLTYILIGDGGFGPSRGASPDVTEWVKAHGTRVGAVEYGGTDSGTGGSGSSLYKLG
ncbi:glycosyltransferase family 39 protein [Microbispora sp. KK1-11]|uniref:ArnT family glycosyltransferase n=1 Tax=Microbispora sp. KK1-11 TaxID=2053005 RepID=UPI0011597589|nr:glycosyltransferase family 39 protein [Microbispora sp. KK1-11]TQS26226.1 glycosyl transferase family 39 [Microbispora sp. KK1-11]